MTHALTAEGHDASEDGTGRGTPLIASPLSHGSNPNSNMAGRRREDAENLVVGALRQHVRPSSNSDHTIMQDGVRRLMPIECERLQDMPDGWTDIPWAGKPHSPDSRRYAGLGDAVTASVGEWIGRRLLAVDAGNARAA